MNIFGGMKIFSIFFLRSSQNWTIFRGISMHFRVKVQNRVFLGGLLKF